MVEGFAAFKEIPPGLELAAQSGKVNSPFRISEHFQFFPAFLEKRREALGIPLRMVVERGGDLNQAVEGNFALTLGLQPHGFERFMRFEKFPAVEQVNGLGDVLFHGLDCSAALPVLACWELALR